MREERRGKKRRSNGLLFKLSFIVFLIILPISLWVIEKNDFLSAIVFVFSRKNIVNYQTYTLSIDSSVKDSYKSEILENLDKLDFNGKKRFKVVEKKGDIHLSMDKGDDAKDFVGSRLIPVGYIYSLVEGIDSLEPYSLYMLDSQFKDYLEEEYGISIEIVDSYDELVKKLEDSDNNIGLVSIEDVDIRVKILQYSGKYFLDDESGSISVNLYASLKKNVDDFVLSVLERNISGTENRMDLDRVVKVNMGGVVAISRALASKIDKSGDYGYPANEIGDFLANADLTHVSNEVSFVSGCTVYSGMRFCSRPEYIEVFKRSGVDIVELTGNHNNDFGSQYNTESIGMYKDLGMRYFGGGLDSEDASKILYEEVNGTKMAFVGYNYYDTIYESLALAGVSRAGANSYSEEKVKRDVQTARENADIVIVTFQFQECYCYPDGDVIYPICYKPLSNPDQKGVFRKAVDFGADIVIGTQAHQPQTYELYGDGVIYYGLGNLYFDQSMWIGTRQGMVLSHYFYNGKHIQTRLVPIYMDKDLIPRLATEEQADLLLELLKDARE